ncbi:MAG: T9SS type A sorting domain-containing protein, partial [Rhodothermales bacterium]
SPGLLSPENHAENVPIPTFLDWTDVSGATAYDLQVSQSNKFDKLVVDTSEVTESGLEVRKLRYKEIYFWRARAVNAGGKSAWTTAQTFVTQTAPPAEQPALVSPFNGAGGLDLSTNLGWNPVSSAVSYDLQVSSEADFLEPLQVDTSVTTTTVTIVVSEYQTRYFWRVRAVNAGGEGPWSDTYHFDTGLAPPSFAPVLVSPASEAVGLPPDLVVVWEPAPGAEKYDLHVSPDSAFARGVLSKTRLDSTSYPLRNLAFDSTYYWRVRARNSGGISAWTVVYRFTIEPEPSRVGSDRPTGMPADFALLQNYPNPFNPQTNIQFELARPEHVRMSVYDTGGRLIEVLMDRSMQAGRFQVEWEASGLPSGVYICRLEAGEFRGHIPLVLMK